MYVSLIKDYAYMENIGHNDNENDPSRGTGLADMRLVPLPDMMVISSPQGILWNQGEITIPDRVEHIDY